MENNQWGKLYLSVQNESQLPKDWICDMLKEGATVYASITNAELFYQVSEPNQSDFNFIKNSEKTIAFQHGNPRPPCPPSGCQ